MRLTPRTQEVLQQMAEHADEEEGTLTQASPGGWWLGNNPVDGKTGYFLLRLCLITEESFCSESVRHYTINEEGRKVLNDPDYVPTILEKLAGVPTE